MKKFFISLVLYSSIGTALACTPGAGGGPTGDPNCMAPILTNDPYYNGSNPPPRKTKPKVIYLKKPDSWGAIAITKPDTLPNPYMTHVTDYSSERTAKKAAIKMCEKAKKVPCVYVSTWANSCLAVSAGRNPLKKVSIFPKSANTSKEAEKIAMQECNASNFTECQIVFPAQCSFPK